MILFAMVICFSCCVIVQSTTGTSLYNCITPDSKPGNRIPLGTCPPLLDILKSTSAGPDQAQFFQRSQFGFSGTKPLICCTNNDTAADNITVTYVVPLRDEAGPRFIPASRIGGVEEALLPLDECGLHTEPKIINGVITAIDEFPWMALLKYNTSKGIKAGCGGVLISKRFVLTAAHCIVGLEAKTLGKPTMVTLGEYNLADVRDCDHGYGVPVCNEAIDVPIEDIFVHENYRKPPERRNDIALIKLSRDIAFDLFISPICLPDTYVVEELVKPDKNMFICGWGQYKRNDPSLSKLKQKARVPVVDIDRCHYIYYRNNIELEKDEIICAGGKGADTCPGDSGGPLMASVEVDGDARYFAMGIVSFGPKQCGLLGVPAIYTNIGFYMDWIIKKLHDNK